MENFKHKFGYEVRDLVIFIFSALVLTFYGTQVCPFLESLKGRELFIVLVAPFVFIWPLRIFLKGVLGKEKAGMDYPRRLMIMDAFIWLLVGFLVTAWNFIYYNFPVESGLKVVFGYLSLGFFSTTYIFLEERYFVIKNSIENKISMDFVREDRFLSITKKFLIFFFATVFIITGVLLLLVYKDFEYVIWALENNEEFMFRWIVQEIMFVFGILIIGTFFVTRQYGKNMQLIFSAELNVLGEIEKGNMDSRVPIITNDEMGMIAKHTNRMISELREKQKIRETFGKYVDKRLAESILQNENGNELGGREKEICVLFSDIRDFTAISEKTDAEVLIGRLNSYFSIIVEVVHEFDGMLDKFIGDSAMVVFGLDDPKRMCEKAIMASLKIQERLLLFNRDDGKNGAPEFNTGIGIHAGKALAGNMGTTERLEYTVIGNTVNTASRIESQCKDLNRSILVSARVYDGLEDKNKFTMVNMGDFCLKGKSEKVTIYSVEMGGETHNA